MPKIAVYNPEGQSTGSMELTTGVFEEKPNLDLLHQVVTAERSNARGPNAHTKTRGEVAGSGRKPWKQKGTGNARAGSIRSPIWRHGGVTFGPRSIRNFSKKVNRPMFHKAVRMVLSDMFAQGKLAVIDSLSLAEIKTKAAVQAVSGLKTATGLTGKTLAIVVKSGDRNLYRSLKNVPTIEVLRVTDVSPYRLLLSSGVMITRDAMAEMERIFAR